MSPDDVKTHLLKFYEQVINGRQLDLAAEFLDDKSIDHTPPPIPDFKQGLEGFKTLMQMWLNTFPDVKMHIEEMVIDGNRVATRATWTGTHKGSMMGEEPTGKSVTGNMIEILHINENGIMTDRWGYGDDMQVFSALGVKPPG